MNPWKHYLTWRMHLKHTWTHFEFMWHVKYMETHISIRLYARWVKVFHESVKDRKTCIHWEAYWHAICHVQAPMDAHFPCYATTKESDMSRNTDMHRNIPKILNTYFYSMWYARLVKIFHETVKDRKTWIHLEAYCQTIWHVQARTSTNGRTSSMPCNNQRTWHVKKRRHA